MTNNLWIPHTGNKCPVDPDTVVEVMLADGDTYIEGASLWCWENVGGTEQIIAYRIVEQPKADKADWENWFDEWGGSPVSFKGIDDFGAVTATATVNEFYEAFAARLKAEGK